eukprot:5490610-Lingulodinium_polyedra.AAC.1
MKKCARTGRCAVEEPNRSKLGGSVTGPPEDCRACALKTVTHTRRRALGNCQGPRTRTPAAYAR